MKSVTQHLKSLSVAGIFFVSLYTLYAWTGPSQLPPGGNVASPINTGANPQTKNGSLTVLGNFLLGLASNPISSLTIHGKGYSESTTNTDTAKTLTTKDYIDNKLSNLVLCVAPWGNTAVATGGSFKAYQSTTAVAPTTCSSISQTRTCGADGNLSGSFINKSCSQVLSVSGLSAPGSSDIPQYTPNTCGQGGNYPIRTIPGFVVKGPSSTYSGGVVVPQNSPVSISMSAYLDYAFMLWVSVNGGAYTNIATIAHPWPGQGTISGTFTYNLNLPVDGYATFAHSAGGCWQNYYVYGGVMLTF